MTEENNYCTLYLVRHGETEFNKAGIMQGHVDSPLTEEGVRQVEATRDNLKHVKFDAVFSSDLYRAQHTAEIIKLDKEILLQTSEFLRESNYGRFDGRPVKEYLEELKEKLLERNKLSDDAVWSYELEEGIETYESAVTRLLLKLREISVAYAGKKVLVVSHGGVLRNFLIKLGYATRNELPPGALANACYIKVRSDGVDFFVDETSGVNTSVKS